MAESSSPSKVAADGKVTEKQSTYMQQFNKAIKQLNNGKEPVAKIKKLEKYGLPHFRRDAPKIVRLYIPVLACVLLVLFSVAYLDYYRVALHGFTGKDFLPHDNLAIEQPHHRTLSTHPQSLALASSKTDKPDVLSHIWVIVGLISFIFLFLLCGTISLLLLYKRGYSQSIQSVSSIPYILYLAIFPLVYIQELVYTLNVAIDWFAVGLFLYNQTVTGILVLFYAGPNWAKKIFYVIVSSMLALFLAKFMNEWIEIGLMVLLICWDLYAVLHSSGPLIGLLNTLQSSKGSDLPPMVFQMTAWQMPTKPHVTISRSRIKASLPPSPIERFELGLGDFIFYSILVAKSFIYAGPLGAIFTIVSLLIGLTVTVIVLILTGHALPAIPIPITLGLLAQLICTYLSGPFGDELNSSMILV